MKTTKIILLLLVVMLSVRCAFAANTYRNTYRIEIYNPNNYRLTNYQIKVNLSRYLKIPSYLKVTENGRILPFTYEEPNNECGLNPTTVIWIKIPEIPADGSTVVHANTTNTNYAVKPDKVFLFYDDFKEGLNTSKWQTQTQTSYATWKVHDGLLDLIVNTNKYWGGKATCKLKYTITNTGFIVKYRAINHGHWNWALNTIFYDSKGDEFSTNINVNYYDCNGFFIKNPPNTAVCGCNENLHINTRVWHVYEFKILPTVQELYIDHKPFATNAWKHYNLTDVTFTKITLSPNGGGAYDWVIARKCAYLKPVVTVTNITYTVHKFHRLNSVSNLENPVNQSAIALITGVFIGVLAVTVVTVLRGRKGKI